METLEDGMGAGKGLEGATGEDGLHLFGEDGGDFPVGKAVPLAKAGFPAEKLTVDTSVNEEEATVLEIGAKGLNLGRGEFPVGTVGKVDIGHRGFEKAGIGKRLDKNRIGGKGKGSCARDFRKEGGQAGGMVALEGFPLDKLDDAELSLTGKELRGLARQRGDGEEEGKKEE